MHQLDSGKPPGTAIKKKPRQTQKGKKKSFLGCASLWNMKTKEEKQIAVWRAEVFMPPSQAEPLFSRTSGTGLCPLLALRAETTSQRQPAAKQGQSCIRIDPDHCGC